MNIEATRTFVRKEYDITVTDDERKELAADGMYPAHSNHKMVEALCVLHDLPYTGNFSVQEFTDRVELTLFIEEEEQA